MFDKNFHTTTAFWGNSYPRPSAELHTNSHVILNNEGIDMEQIIEVEGKLVFDMKTFKQAQEKWVQLKPAKADILEDEASAKVDLKN